MLPWIIVSAAALAAALYVERRELDRLLWIFKPLASAGFVGAAIAVGGPDTPYGMAVLVALVWCMLGDVLLIPRGTSPAFLFGVAAFLMGHLGFAVAFNVHGVDGTWLLVGLAALALPVVGILRWLRPHVRGGMWLAINAYVAVITFMVAMAVGALGHPSPGGPLILAGATCFWASDLFVARERFVQKSPWNRFVGLPLYYVAQFLLVASIPAAYAV